MDPVTALLQLSNTVAQIVLEAMQGQTPEQRAKIWDWYIKDIEFWRTLLKLDKEKP